HLPRRPPFPTRRSSDLEQFAEYKAGRAEAPDEFRQQLGLIREVLQTLAIPIVEVEGHEADDAIATLACRAAERGLDAVIVTADRSEEHTSELQSRGHLV